MSAFGIPGAGGSLGACAYCGEPFLGKILLGKPIVRFSIQGNHLAAHPACFDRYGKCEDWAKLPEGPLRRAAQSASIKQPEVKE